MNELAKQIHEYAKAKGFWDNPRDTGTLLMLIVSELAEAMEADRNGRIANLSGFHKGIAHEDIFEASIKDTFEDEMADTIIRILDLCAAKGIDIDRHIELKMKYNTTREQLVCDNCKKDMFGTTIGGNKICRNCGKPQLPNKPIN